MRILPVMLLSRVCVYYKMRMKGAFLCEGKLKKKGIRNEKMDI